MFSSHEEALRLADWNTVGFLRMATMEMPFYDEVQHVNGI